MTAPRPPLDTADPRSDEEVLAAYVAAESPRNRESAFAVLVDRYDRRVYAICYRHFGNHADAQDATQDTFIALARRAGQFRGDSKLSTFIYRVATNACLDLGRKRARRPQTPVGDASDMLGDVAADDPSVAEIAEGSDLAQAVQAALLQLDETTRTLVILCTIEGRDYKEVAEILDLPLGTVKSRVHRARAKLAEILAPALQVGDEPGPGPASPAGDQHRDVRQGGRPDRPRGPPS